MADPKLASASLPMDNLASGQFSAWLAAFNSQDRDTLLAYRKTHFPFDLESDGIGAIDREVHMSKFTGGFDIVNSLVSSSNLTPYTVDVVLRERKRPQYVHAMMEVDRHKEGYPVTRFEINTTHTPIEYVPEDRKKEFMRALAPLTPARRRVVIKETSGAVREQYIFPDVGEEMIRDLEAKQESGEYDGYKDSEVFAQRLTEDMQAISGDKHIRITFGEPPPRRKSEAGDDDGDDGREPQKLLDVLRDINFDFGIPSVEIIQGKKLGILPIEGFVPVTPDIASDSAAIREAISDLMSEIAEADALLVDLRTNGGGHPAAVAFVLSYLVDGAPTPLNNMVDRKGSAKESYSTLPAADLPENAARFGGSKPLFVLTTKDTISGGEEMAYDLQALKRANAIIGEDATTAGAANPVTDPKFICEEEFGKNWWCVAVPGMRPVNAVTGTNWEGVGVKSDVVVKKGDGDARDVGRKMAMEALGLGEGAATNESGG